MLDEKLSLHELLDYQEADKNFWISLEELNLKKNNGDSHIHLTLVSLHKKIQALQLSPDKTKAAYRSIKEQAIQLLCAEFPTATMALKKQFLLALYQKASFEALNKIMKKMYLDACDDVLADMTKPFDGPSDYSFIDTAIAHKIITKQKPTKIYFDERRAFSLLHERQSFFVMEKINNFTKSLRRSQFFSLTLTFKSLQNYHPFVAKQSQERCKRAFNDAFLGGLTHVSGNASFLIEEYNRAEQKKPFFLLRPFYAKTMRAIKAWQYELLMQNLKMMRHSIEYLKKYREGLINWFRELHSTGPVNFLLYKKFRDFFIKLVMDKNAETRKNYNRLVMQLQSREASNYLRHDLSFSCEMQQSLRDNHIKLEELLKSTLATVDLAEITEVRSDISKGTQHACYRGLIAGEKISDTLFSIWLSKEIKEAYPGQKECLERLMQQWIEKISDDDSSPSRDYGYIKQVLEIFIQFKRDSFLTQMKKALQLLPEKQKQHAVIKYCLSQIGLTVAERLLQVQNIAKELNQACIEMEARFFKKTSTHKLFSEYAGKLLQYAIKNNLDSWSQLLVSQSVDARLFVKFLRTTTTSENANKIVENMMDVAKKRRLLANYNELEKQLTVLHAQDKFVPESALPMPESEHSDTHIMRGHP